MLDELNSNKYQQLVRDLLRDLGVRVSTVPNPHLSYHVSNTYQAEQLLPLLEQVTWQMEPFVLQVSGLGVFTGPEPVVYASIVRSRQLSKLHETLWELADPVCPNPSKLYHPDNWMPHITLLDGHNLAFRLSYVVDWLNKHDFQHQLFIDNLTFWVKGAEPTVFSFGQ